MKWNSTQSSQRELQRNLSPGWTRQIRSWSIRFRLTTKRCVLGTFNQTVPEALCFYTRLLFNETFSVHRIVLTLQYQRLLSWSQLLITWFYGRRIWYGGHLTTVMWWRFLHVYSRHLLVSNDWAGIGSPCHPSVTKALTWPNMSWSWF